MLARTDPSEARAFLEPLIPLVDTPATQEAFVTAKMELAHFQLLLGELDATKESMYSCAKILERFDAVEPLTHAAYYRVCGDYYKVSLVKR
jgi:26S proteasome regulatory subunit N9